MWRRISGTRSLSQMRRTISGARGLLKMRHSTHTSTVLTTPQQTRIDTTRETLTSLIAELEHLNAEPSDRRVIAQARAHLDELFVLCVVGEFNSGKSSLINALVEEPLLEEGVTPTTSRVHVISAAPDIAQAAPTYCTEADSSPLMIQSNAEWLRHVHLVDTPGTNAVVSGHREITDAIIPRSDLVMFVTSVERPFSDSEQTFLRQIQSWHKKVVVVLNKWDLLQGREEDQRTILDFVKLEASKALGSGGRQGEGATIIQTSGKGTEPGCEQLRRYVLELLEDGNSFELKVQSIASVGGKMVEKYLKVLDQRNVVIEADLEALVRVEKDLEAFGADTKGELDAHLAKVDHRLRDMVERADDFFSEHLQWSQVPQLVWSDGTALQVKFEKQVLADYGIKIDSDIEVVVDWLTRKCERHAGASLELLSARLERVENQLVGKVAVDPWLSQNRFQLLRGAKSEVRQMLTDAEPGSTFTKKVSASVATGAAIEVGALGVGALVAASMLDWTGLAGAGMLAVVGAGVIPYRRRTLKAEFASRTGELRIAVRSALEEQLAELLDQSTERITDSVSPYSRFVRQEQKKVLTHKASLKALDL